MRLLLDTHVFLWLHTDRSRLPPTLLRALGDPGHSLHLSVASGWEIGIKHALGRLPMPEPPADWLASRLPASGTTALAITLPHVLTAAALPRLHDDPFDRLLVAQAQVEELTLVTGDAQLSAYDVPIRWDSL